jgi:hypothetical protein
MNDAGLNRGELPYGVDRLGQTFEAVTDRDAHISHAAVLQLGQDLQPKLGALVAVAGPQPQDVAFPVDGDSDNDIDGLVADLPVAHLHHDGIDEQHRIDLIQGPVHPRRHLLQHLVGDLGDRLPRHRGAVHLGEVRRNLPGRQPARRQRQHDLIHPGQPALPLPHNRRSERGLDITRHLDLHRADLGQHRLGPHPVAGVATVAPIGSCLS